MRQYAPDLCSAHEMAYLISMKPSEFKEAVRTGFLPAPIQQPFTGKELWDRQTVLDMVRSQTGKKSPTQQTILDAARG
ncbi:hypothetical protein FDK21_19250 [Cohaesibacter sp. CAU 1516]|uniref:hypothetical protein n=1 Tax=Cohaesibacter sp. CAU 1516 TaxID=2576038 RepID=UPI0010FD6CB3|nr:hypothetical protein [Cohaesibacter sp. CAU 1516]TLP42651.1 hypothetical protein FDK21_19250 [Cohaesibacter sp. CAU 1516]